MERRKPSIHFSLRSMLLAMTAMCLALATWALGKSLAIAELQIATREPTTETIVPYLLCVTKSDNVMVRETYYLWCFGPTIRLPYSQSYPDPYDGVDYGGVRPRLIFQDDEEPEPLAIER